MNVYYANIECEIYFTKKPLSVHQYWFNSSASFKFHILKVDNELKLPLLVYSTDEKRQVNCKWLINSECSLWILLTQSMVIWNYGIDKPGFSYFKSFVFVKYARCGLLSIFFGCPCIINQLYFVWVEDSNRRVLSNCLFKEVSPRAIYQR